MLERIWRENYRLLRHIAARIHRDSTRVDDIMQDAFLRMLEQRKHPRVGVAYVRAVVRNTAIEHYRKELRGRLPAELATRPGPPTPYEVLLGREEDHCRARVVKRAASLTKRLPQQQKQAVRLVFFRNGHTLTHVCAENGEATSTVWSRMRMALKEIRRDLEDCGLYEEYCRALGRKALADSLTGPRREPAEPAEQA